VTEWQVVTVIAVGMWPLVFLLGRWWEIRQWNNPEWVARFVAGKRAGLGNRCACRMVDGVLQVTPGCTVHQVREFRDRPGRGGRGSKQEGGDT
jgi:hypothetical protein